MCHKTTAALDKGFYIRPSYTKAWNKLEQMVASTNDEVESETTVVTNKYRARQAYCFNMVGGGPKGWMACDIDPSTSTTEHIRYLIPKGYTEVKAYSLTPDGAQKLREIQEADARARAGNSNPDKPRTLCELCGFIIINPVPIKNDARQTVLYVGVVCAENFLGAGYFTKQVKTYRETKLRSAFRDWVTIALADLDSRINRSRSWGEKKPYYMFRKKLQKAMGVISEWDGVSKWVSKLDPTKVNQLSSRKIVNFLTKARYELKLGVPLGLIPSDSAPVKVEWKAT